MLVSTILKISKSFLSKHSLSTTFGVKLNWKFGHLQNHQIKFSPKREFTSIHGKLAIEITMIFNIFLHNCICNTSTSPWVVMGVINYRKFASKHYGVSSFNIGLSRPPVPLKSKEMYIENVWETVQVLMSLVSSFNWPVA